MFIMILVRLALVRLVFIKRIERRNLGDDTTATFNGRRAVYFDWMGTKCLQSKSGCGRQVGGATVKWTNSVIWSNQSAQTFEKLKASLCYPS